MNNLNDNINEKRFIIDLQNNLLIFPRLIKLFIQPWGKNNFSTKTLKNKQPYQNFLLQL